MGYRTGLITLLLTGFMGAASGGDRTIIRLPETRADLPYSPGILVDGFLYLSGALPARPGESGFPDGIEAQTEQVILNLRSVLTAAGLDLADVLSTTVYLADARHYAGMNRAYQRWFGDSPPARATVEGAIVVPGALVEISAVAAVDGRKAARVVPEGWPRPAAPFSWAVRHGDTLFVSGLVGSDPVSGKKGETFDTQAEQLFRNLNKVLADSGFSAADVVSSRVYLSDARTFPQLNTAFRNFFPENPPSRATVEARLADPELSIEVQCTAVRDPHRKIVGTRGDAPFSPAVAAGNRLFLSGMIGRGTGGLAPGDIREQTRQTVGNLLSVLEQAGLSLADVAESTVYLADVRHFQAMNEVYRQLLPEAPPARATTGTRMMSPDALVEIMFTAHFPGGRSRGGE